MSKQRIIRDEMWSDEWFYDLDPSEKLLWVFLLTNPRCNIAGIYKVNISWIGNHTGFEKKVVEMLLERFEKEGKIVFVHGHVFIKNFLKNQAESPNVIKGINRIFDELSTEMQEYFTNNSTTPVEEGASKGYHTLLNFTLLNSTKLNLDTTNVVGKSQELEKNQNPDGSYGNPEINKIFDFWHETIGYKVQGKKQANRNAAKNLIKKHSYEGVERLILGIAKANEDRFAPRIADFVELQSNYNKLLAWGNKILVDDSKTQKVYGE